MQKKTIIAIVGRSGAGKDTFVRKAANEFHIPVVVSYTDRPIREGTEVNGREHRFLSKEEMDKVCENPEHLLAYTQIGENGYRYCVTKDQIQEMEGDFIFYIIDPNGVKYLKEHESEFQTQIISIMTPDTLRRERAIARNGESTAFDKRALDEKEQFDTFEHNPLNYDYRILNTNFESSYERFRQCIKNIMRQKRMETHIHSHISYSDISELPMDSVLETPCTVHANIHVSLPLLQGESKEDATKRIHSIASDVFQVEAVELDPMERE